MFDEHRRFGAFDFAYHLSYVSAADKKAANLSNVGGVVSALGAWSMNSTLPDYCLACRM
jgi:hypothetical protein